jgi:arabinofuranosyltransferase
VSIPASDTVPAARVAPDAIGVVGPRSEEPERPERSPHAVPRIRRWNALMVVLPTVALTVLGWRHRALTDDGLIFLRTVRQVLAGHGPVVNIDERIEANTSTLWQWILVGLGAVLPGDLGGIAVYAGLFLTTAGLALALDATRRLHPATTVLLPAGVLVPLAVPPFWDFATAGLDTGLGTCWLGGCWWLLVRTRDAAGPGERAWHAVWFGLGVLVRPDLALVTGFFLAGAWLAVRPGLRGAGCQVAAAMAMPTAYEVFRMGYYGLLVPLPALTKEPGASEIRRGLAYAADFALPYWLYVPALVLAAVLVAVAVAGGESADRGRLAVLLTPPAAAVAVVVYVIRLGGDYMHARMLLPAMFLALLPVLLVPARRTTVTAVVLVGLWAVLCVGPWNPDAYHHSNVATAIRVRDTDIGITGTANPNTAAQWVTAFPGLRAAVALGQGQERPVLVRMGPDGKPDAFLPLNPVYRDTHVSVPGGYLGVTGQIVPLDERIVEVWGLANTIGAHLEYPSDWRTKWPGHRKLVDGAWLLALDLDPAVTLVPPGSVDVTDASLAAARHALTCGALAELLASTREPLTPARFADNFTGALARTTLRIPRDPFAAEHTFCATPR